GLGTEDQLRAGAVRGGVVMVGGRRGDVIRGDSDEPCQPFCVPGGPPNPLEEQQVPARDEAPMVLKRSPGERHVLVGNSAAIAVESLFCCPCELLVAL